MAIVKGEYKYKEDSKLEYINGAYGGINTLGEVHVHFYFESVDNNSAFTIELDDGIVSENVENSNIIFRDVKSNIVMSVDTARAIHKLLESLIERSEMNRNKELGGSNDKD